MPVSEMQIQSRSRPVIAEMEKGIFKIVDELQKEALAINIRQIQNNFLDGLRIMQNQCSEIVYFDDNHPEVRGVPPSQRHSEKRKLNKPAREIIRSIKYCQEHPNITPEDLTKLRTTLFREFPSHIQISTIPLMVAWGETFVRLAEIEKCLKNDDDEELADGIAKTPNVRPKQPA